MNFQPTSRDEGTVRVRWLVRRDMPEVLKIEGGSFSRPWTEEDFLCCLRQRNCIGMVAEDRDRVVGFMIYELHKSRLHIVNFAVDPAARKQGVGRQMIGRLVDKLSQQRRTQIVLTVRETNLDAQLFFRKQGFRAVRVVRGYYDDTAEDAYLMEYRLSDAPDGLLPFSPQNRISEYYDAA